MKGYLLFLPLILFVIAGITDGLDGYAARKMKLPSRFGIYLDPLADKLLVSLVLITLTYLKIVPLWITIVLVGREFVITSLRAFYAIEGVKLAPSIYGKLKTTFQIIGISAFLFFLPLKTIFFYYFGLFLLCLAILFSLLSAFLYILPLFRVSTKPTI